MNKTELNIKDTLIQQCNYWFSQFKKLEKYPNINNNQNLMIEALGCAKGNLCILKELDKDNSSIYEDFIYNINSKLEEIYDKKNKRQLKRNLVLSNKVKNNTLLN